MTAPREFPQWDELYQNQAVEGMPWFYAELDPDLAQALEGRPPGRILDLGTGPGTQAMALAGRGFTVTAADLSGTAVELAAARAREKGLRIDFRQDDILESRLEGGFDYIFDRGCFHVFAAELRPVYVRQVHRLLEPGGTLFLKCFSTQQPGDRGPYRFSPDQIREIFGGQFRLESIDETVYQGTLDPLPRALFCVLSRPG